MAHRIPSFFKSAKNKRFNYDPWFYDPVKEELDERRSAIRRQLKMDSDGSPKHLPGSGIRGSFKSVNPRRGTNTGMLRLVIALVLLLGVLYIVLS